MLTSEVFTRVCPRCPAAHVSRIVSALTAAFAESTVTTPARVAAFLAQAAHESGEFRYWHERWGPTLAQQRYEGRHDLGNSEPGDGFRYRGRGPFQLTGRANYRAAGERLGYPLEADPDLVAEPPVGCLVAVDFWESRNLSPLADMETTDAFRVITRRINGGLNGLADRERYHAVARQAVGLTVLQEA